MVDHNFWIRIRAGIAGRARAQYWEQQGHPNLVRARAKLAEIVAERKRQAALAEAEAQPEPELVEAEPEPQPVIDDAARRKLDGY